MLKARLFALLVALALLLIPTGASTARVVSPPSDWRPLMRQAFAALTGLVRYHYTRIERYASGEVYTQIEGDVVGPDSVSIYGVYQHMPVAVIIRGATAYEAHAGAWVQRPVSDTMRSWLPRPAVLVTPPPYFDLRQPLSGLPDLVDIYQDPAPPGRPQIAHVDDLGEATVDGRPVRMYRFRGTDPATIAINMPRSTICWVWLNPDTARIYKYSWAGNGWAGEVTISRHDDPTLALPTP